MALSCSSGVSRAAGLSNPPVSVDPFNHRLVETIPWGRLPGRDIFLHRGGTKTARHLSCSDMSSGDDVQPHPVHPGMAMASGGGGSGPGAGFDQHGRSGPAARNGRRAVRSARHADDRRRRWFRRVRCMRRALLPFRRPHGVQKLVHLRRCQGVGVASFAHVLFALVPEDHSHPLPAYGTNRRIGGGHRSLRRDLAGAQHSQSPVMPRTGR